MTDEYNGSRELKLAVKTASYGGKEKALILFDPDSVTEEHEDVYDKFIEGADEIDYETELKTNKGVKEAVEAILEEYPGKDMTQDGVATIYLWEADAERLEKDLEEDSTIL